MSGIKIAICQMTVGSDKNINLRKAEEMIGSAARQGAGWVVLPEIFNAPYQCSLFSAYAEVYGEETTSLLASLARIHKICLIGGSIPEKDSDNNIYNTSFIFGPDGKLIGKHRKLHLFDIDIPGRITFQESDALSPGQTLSLFEYNGVKFGLIICYDVRFPELARILTLQGARLLIIPGAFNLTTGPAHWELLMRSRAVDNQFFVAAAAPARNPEASYQAWGHSMVVDPWGTVIASADETEQIICADIDLKQIDQIRREIPVLKQRRTDLYR